MKKLEINNNVITLLERDQFKLDYQKEERRKILKNKFIFAFAIAVIIFLLIPSFSFINQVPRAGDFIPNDIVAESNILLKDKEATKFKIEKNLSNLGLFLDYDPLVYQKLIEKIHASFTVFLAENKKLQFQEQNLQEEIKKISQENFLIQQNQQQLIKDKKFHQQHAVFLRNKTGIIQFEKAINRLEVNEKNIQQELENIQLAVKKVQVKSEEFFKNKKANYDNNLGELFQSFKLDFDREVFQLLSQVGDFNLFLERLVAVLRVLERVYILDSKESVESNIDKEISIFNLETDTNIDYSNRIQFKDIEEVKKIIKQYIDTNFQDTNYLNLALYLFASKLIMPSIFENKQKLENQRKLISNESNSVFVNIEKGAVLVAGGKVLSIKEQLLLEDYYLILNQNKGFFYTLGIVLATMLLVFIIFFTLKIERKSVDSFYESFVILAATSAISLIVIFLTKILLEIFLIQFSFPLEGYFYALPITLGVMLSGGLVNIKTNIFNAFFCAFIVSFYLDQSFYFFLYCWFSASLTCLIFTNLNTRFDLLKKGFITAVLNLLVLFLLELLKDPKNIDVVILKSLIFAFTGGILSTIYSIIFLPLFEQIFGISTQLKLLELFNLNHPLLRLLQNRCLGTYQHSILVGNLAEVGAQKIGINPLLAKVGAYYHDIGKAVEPQYFNENYYSNENSPHHKLSPQESANKIINHIIYGIQLAKKFKLGRSITEVIMEHHGNSIIEFFYNKAQKTGKISNKESFRYPMPRPRSLETTIIMLADKSEVAVRTLLKPTKDKITNTIDSVFQNILDEQQLDKSGISVEQLRIIKETFIDILVSLNHNRIT